MPITMPLQPGSVAACTLSRMTFMPCTALAILIANATARPAFG